MLCVDWRLIALTPQQNTLPWQKSKVHALDVPHKRFSVHKVHMHTAH